MKTYTLKQREIAKDWVILDATDVPLGRLATRVSSLLRGKHKPTYTAHLDMSDNVIVVNAARVRLTGLKLDKKTYLRYTGYMGGQRTATLKGLMATRPEKVVEQAVWGMMPKNRLSRRLMTHLRVYSGAEHPHAAQQPRASGLA